MSVSALQFPFVAVTFLRVHVRGCMLIFPRDSGSLCLSGVNQNLVLVFGFLVLVCGVRVLNSYSVYFWCPFFSQCFVVPVSGRDNSGVFLVPGVLVGVWCWCSVFVC